MLRVSDFTENYNELMSRYAENISKMTQSVQGRYTSVPEVYYNKNTLNSMIKLAESLSKSSFANIENKELYEALQKNFAFQRKVFKQEDLKKTGEKTRYSLPDIDALSSNLQRAAKAVQIRIQEFR